MIISNLHHKAFPCSRQRKCMCSRLYRCCMRHYSDMGLTRNRQFLNFLLIDDYNLSIDKNMHTNGDTLMSFRYARTCKKAKSVQTCFTVCSCVAISTSAGVAVYQFIACSTILTRVREAFVNF